MIPERRLSEVTNGARLPLPPVPTEIMEVLAEKVAKVWADASPEIDWETRHEIDFNLLLVARLNAAVFDDPMFAQLVHEVMRGSELVDVSGERPEVRPDLQFSLTRRHPGLPLVGECKVLDRSLNRGMALYCSRGISRFVSGQYGWYRSEGLMIAYVLDGSIKDEHLLPEMRRRFEEFDLLSEHPVTRHARHFRYTHVPEPQNQPGSIDLWHLWLTLPSDPRAIAVVVPS